MLGAALLVLVHLLPTTASASFSLPLIANHGGDADGFMVVNATNVHLRPAVTPPVEYTYSGVVPVGTGAGKDTYFLVLDTASSLTWMQCKPCSPELPQHGPVFDPGHSDSYRPLHPTSSLCRPPSPVHPTSDKCAFHLRGANGYVGLDTVCLGSPDLPVHGFAFGCTHATEGFETHGTFAGKIGMGRQHTSLIMQIKDRAHWQFSYCPFGYDHAGRHGYIRFGAVVPERPPSILHRTKVLSPPHPDAGDSAYYVSLLGVSINGVRIPGIHPSMFVRRREGGGGCVIDAGRQMTVMAPEAYARVEAEVAAVMREWGKRVRVPRRQLRRLLPREADDRVARPEADAALGGRARGAAPLPAAVAGEDVVCMGVRVADGPPRPRDAASR